MIAGLFREGGRIAVLPYRIAESKDSVLAVPDASRLRVRAAEDAPSGSSFWWGNIHLWTDATVYHYEVACPKEGVD